MFFRKKKDPIQAELDQIRNEQRTDIRYNDSQPSHNKAGEFEMYVQDVFTIAGRGTVLTGKISFGQVRVGDTIKLNNSIECKVKGIEIFRKSLDTAKSGDDVGLLVDISRKDVPAQAFVTK